MEIKSLDLFNIINLSPTEELSGKQLNDFQRAVLHNLRAVKAEVLLRLPFTPENVVDYAQQESYLTGQVELLDYLLLPIESPTNEESEK